MASKFMKIKRIIIPFISLVILTSQLMGCAAMSQEEVASELANGTEVEIELAEPSGVDSQQTQATATPEQVQAESGFKPKLPSEMGDEYWEREARMDLAGAEMFLSEAWADEYSPEEQVAKAEEQMSRVYAEIQYLTEISEEMQAEIDEVERSIADAKTQQQAKQEQEVKQQQQAQQAAKQEQQAQQASQQEQQADTDSTPSSEDDYDKALLEWVFEGKTPEELRESAEASTRQNDELGLQVRG